MTKPLFTAVVVLVFCFGASAARAHDGFYLGFDYGYGGYYHHYGPGWSLGFYWPFWGYYWPPQAYYPPPATYYAPPRAPYCVQDRVYRYLPDGRIQWGTRTRCY